MANCLLVAGCRAQDVPWGHRHVDGEIKCMVSLAGGSLASAGSDKKILTWIFISRLRCSREAFLRVQLDMNVVSPKSNSVHGKFSKLLGCQ